MVAEGPVSLASIRNAADNIQPFVHETRVLTSEFLDGICGRSLLFKCELFQKTGSFKARGMMNGVLAAKARGLSKVVTHSSGNAGQALAWAARAAGLEAHIVVPRDAPAIKKAAIEGYGAKLILCEPSNAAREATANEVVQREGAALVHPSNDPEVINGQGTIALEFVEQARSHWGRDLEAVIVPIGGGGMIGGMAVAIKGLLPACKVIAAEPANADDAYRSKAAGKILDHDRPVRTIADGLKTLLGSNTFPIVRDQVDEIFRVDETAIASATRAVWERMKLAIEPSAGVGVAVAAGAEFREKHPNLTRVGVVLCGGNADLAAISGILAAATPLGSEMPVPSVAEAVSGTGDGTEAPSNADLPWDLEKREGVNDAFLKAWAKENKHARAINLDECDGPVSDAAVVDLATTCSNLEAVSMRSCRELTDASITAFAEKCPRLHTLCLGGCPKITDAGVATLTEHCRGLRTIDLACARISDASAQSLAKYCHELQAVDLSVNARITDDGVTALAEKCPQLRSFEVIRCPKVSDSGVRALAEHCSGLQLVAFAACSRVTDAGVTFLAEHCRDLRSVNLIGCAVTDAGVIALAGSCPGLTAVEVSGLEDVTDRGVAELAQRCSGLRSLGLRRCTVTDASAAALAKHCRHLETLSLASEAEITGACHTNLWATLPRLAIDMDGTVLTKPCDAKAESVSHGDKVEANLQEVQADEATIQWDLSADPGIGNGFLKKWAKANTHARAVCLDGCSSVTHIAVVELAKCCSNLEAVSLRECKELTDDTVTVLAGKCPRLHTLCLGSCPKITDVGVTALAQHAPELRTVDLVCLRISDTSIEALAKHCPRLRYADFSLCRITDEGITAFVKKCPELRTMLMRCTKVSDVSVTALAQHCTSIHTINLACSKVTDEGLNALAKGCSGLRSIDVSGCPAVTDAGVIGLSLSCQELRSVSLGNCQGITDKGVASIVQCCHRLESMILRRCTITDASAEAITQHCQHLQSIALTNGAISNGVIKKLQTALPRLEIDLQ